jgi:hypothetical protein
MVSEECGFNEERAEQYIQKDFSNGTAGEFIIDLHLRRSGDRWTVVLSDEMTLAEFHSAREPGLG